MWEKELEKQKNILALNIKTIRTRANLSQEKLALEAGVDRTLVSKIERKMANPSIEILIKLGIALKVSVVTLLK
jgi:transcriptional regulator with XRE-family HTH domain